MKKIFNIILETIERSNDHIYPVIAVSWQWYCLAFYQMLNNLCSLWLGPRCVSWAEVLWVGPRCCNLGRGVVSCAEVLWVEPRCCELSRGVVSCAEVLWLGPRCCELCRGVVTWAEVLWVEPRCCRRCRGVVSRAGVLWEEPRCCELRRGVHKGEETNLEKLLIIKIKEVYKNFASKHGTFKLWLNHYKTQVNRRVI